MTKEDFIAHVEAHAGAPSSLAARVTHAVLAWIGGSLSPATRHLVGGELPPALGAAVIAGSDRARPIEEDVLALDANLGHARELIASVCRVLAEALSTEALEALRANVPETLATLLEAPIPSEVPPQPAPGHPGETLAAGRPGSRHPVSSAHGSSAQSESIAADNPHAATKLSSAPGSTQERHRETLAEGHPGSPNPIAGSRH